MATPIASIVFLIPAQSSLDRECESGEFHSISLLFGPGFFTQNHDHQNAQSKSHIHGCDLLIQQKVRPCQGQEGLQQLYLPHPRHAAQREAPVPKEEPYVHGHQADIGEGNDGGRGH